MRNNADRMPVVADAKLPALTRTRGRLEVDQDGMEPSELKGSAGGAMSV